MNDEIINYEQLIRLAFSKQIKVHLVLKDKTWRNGFVKEVLNDFFMFDDVENRQEPFFYIQVENVQPFMERKKDG